MWLDSGVLGQVARLFYFIPKCLGSPLRSAPVRLAGGACHLMDLKDGVDLTSQKQRKKLETKPSSSPDGSHLQCYVSDAFLQYLACSSECLHCPSSLYISIIALIRSAWDYKTGECSSLTPHLAAKAQKSSDVNWVSLSRSICSRTA